MFKTEEEYFIDLIRDLAVSYIKQEECLILVVISMKGNFIHDAANKCSDDIENQSAVRIAREWDPNGTRTIGSSITDSSLIVGVLTKADTVEKGDHERWFKIFNNQLHVLRHGYHMTRLSSAAEMNQDWSTTREMEHEFFRAQSPWSQLDKSRVGMESLTEALSRALSKMIEDRYNCLLTI
jgi:hypothetical protein